MEPHTDFDRHKKALGILFLVFSLLNILALAGLVIFSSFFFSFVEVPPDDMMIIELIKYAVLTYVLIFSLPSIFVGIGLINKKNWALTGALILGILGLPAFPFWTFIGIYAIVVFFLYQKEKDPVKASRQ